MNENMIFCLDDISVASLYPLLIKFLMEHMVFATSTSVRMFWLWFGCASINITQVWLAYLFVLDMSNCEVTVVTYY